MFFTSQPTRGLEERLEQGRGENRGFAGTEQEGSWVGGIFLPSTVIPLVLYICYIVRHIYCASVALCGKNDTVPYRNNQ